MIKKVALTTLTALALGTPVTVSADTFGQDNPNGERTEYVVKQGDTLSTIAWREGFSLGSLALTNHIEDWDNIQVGQKLVLDYTPTVYDEQAINLENQLTEEYKQRTGNTQVDDETYNNIAWQAWEEQR